MQSNMCINCGGDYEYRNGRWICRACGSYKPEEISNEEVTLLYTASQKLRLADFDEAEQEFDDIVRKYPQNPNGYWGRLMSRYGIKYEEDFDGKRIPTCYATSIESLVQDPDYRNALKYADQETKAFYTQTAEYIERVRKEWVEKARKEKPYDIFICYKDSDLANGIERTQDSIAAQDLYIHLTNKGYRVFYSHESLRDKAGEKYEPYIFSALSTAKVMLVYGSKPEYITSTWLKNEWTRYEKKIKAGEKKSNSLLVACDGFSPNALPKMLSSKQCLDANRRSFYSDLDAVIDRIMSESKGGGVTAAGTPVKRRRKAPVIAALLALVVLALGGFLVMNTLNSTAGQDTLANNQYQATVVALDQAFPEGTSFNVMEVSKAAQTENLKTVIGSLPVKKNNYHVFDMSLLCNGEVIEVDGSITVTLKIPADIEASRAVVYYLTESGSQKIYSQTVNGKITFVTDHFSYYLIAEEDSAQGESEVPPETEVSPETEDKTETTDGASTGVQIPGIEPDTDDPADTDEPAVTDEPVIDCEHAWTVSHEVRPTCTETGLTKGEYCSLCGEVSIPQETVDALGHTPGEEATCTEAQRCTRCKEELKAPKGHTPGASPTCTMTQICMVCHDELAPALGHTVIHQNRVDPTCTTAGKTEGSYCSVCHEVFATQTTLAATGHSEIVLPAVPPTCTANGKTEGIGCANCDEIIYPQEILPTISHKEVTVPAVAPTCTTAGKTSGTYCAACRQTIVEQAAVPALGHSFTSVVTPPTASENGTVLHTCETCHHAYTDELIPENTVITEENRIHVGFTGNANENLTIPAVFEVDGTWYRVVGIGNGAFMNASGLNSVILPDSVTTLDDYAFAGCSELHTLSLPAGLTTIGASAFEGCATLISVSIPQSVTSIGAAAFKHCACLPSVTWPVTVTEIAEQTFEGCTGLVSILLPDQVTSIGAQALSGCSAMTDVFYTGSESAWTNVIIGAGNDVLNAVTFHFDFDPNHVHTPGPEATCTTAQECTDCHVILAAAIGHIRMTDVAVAPTCTVEGSTEGAHCTACGEIFVAVETIPALGHTEATMDGCEPTCTDTGLTSGTYCTVCDEILLAQTVIAAKGHTYSTHVVPPTEDSDGETVYTCTVCNHTYTEITSLVEFTVTSENRHLVGFTGASDEILVIPAVIDGGDVWYKVTAIGIEAFKDCTNLISVILPDSVSIIDESAFAGCSGLMKVFFGTGLTNIGNYAFQDCVSLTEIALPASLTHIGTSSFMNCTALMALNFADDGQLEKIDSYAFSGCTSLTEVVIPDSVLFIYQGAFRNCTSLERITIPFVGYTRNATKNMHFGYIFGATSADNHVKTIPASLTSVTVTGGTTLGTYAFKNCTSLTEILLPDTLTTIGKTAFSGCKNLVSITLPDSVTSIADFAFNGCTALTSVVIPHEITSIGIYTFSGCSSLTSVSIPVSVTVIGDSAFNGCSALTDIYYDGTGDEWASIRISTGNDVLVSATLHHN